MKTSQIQLKAFNLQVKWHIWRCHDYSKALSKDQGVVVFPIVGMILPLISIWNHPVHKKLTIPHCMATPYTFCYGPTLCGLCFSLNLNTSTSYLLCISHWILFAMRHQEPELYLVLKSGTVGFGQAQVPGRYDWVIKHSTESLQWEFESQSWINSFKCNFQKWKDDDLPNTL